MKGNKNSIKWMWLFLSIFLITSLAGCETLLMDTASDSAISTNASSSKAMEWSQSSEEATENETSEMTNTVVEGESYSTKDEVAAYIHLFKTLPPNYLTKNEARDLGWDNADGNLWEVTDRMSIGGDYFGNRESLLPKKKGRSYYEADINYDGGYRGAERIIFSNDGLIFYTADHYESFEQLYGEGE